MDVTNCQPQEFVDDDDERVKIETAKHVGNLMATPEFRKRLREGGPDKIPTHALRRTAFSIICFAGAFLLVCGCFRHHSINSPNLDDASDLGCAAQATATRQVMDEALLAGVVQLADPAGLDAAVPPQSLSSQRTSLDHTKDVASFHFTSLSACAYMLVGMCNELESRPRYHTPPVAAPAALAAPPPQANTVTADPTKATTSAKAATTQAALISIMLTAWFILLTALVVKLAHEAAPHLIGVSWTGNGELDAEPTQSFLDAPVALTTTPTIVSSFQLVRSDSEGDWRANGPTTNTFSTSVSYINSQDENMLPSAGTLALAPAVPDPDGSFGYLDATGDNALTHIDSIGSECFMVIGGAYCSTLSTGIFAGEVNEQMSPLFYANLRNTAASHAKPPGVDSSLNRFCSPTPLAMDMLTPAEPPSPFPGFPPLTDHANPPRISQDDEKAPPEDEQAPTSSVTSWGSSGAGSHRGQGENRLPAAPRQPADALALGLALPLAANLAVEVGIGSERLEGKGLRSPDSPPWPFVYPSSAERALYMATPTSSTGSYGSDGRAHVATAAAVCAESTAVIFDLNHFDDNGDELSTQSAGVAKAEGNCDVAADAPLLSANSAAMEKRIPCPPKGRFPTHKAHVGAVHDTPRASDVRVPDVSSAAGSTSSAGAGSSCGCGGSPCKTATDAVVESPDADVGTPTWPPRADNSSADAVICPDDVDSIISSEALRIADSLLFDGSKGHVQGSLGAPWSAVLDQLRSVRGPATDRATCLLEGRQEPGRDYAAVAAATSVLLTDIKTHTKRVQLAACAGDAVQLRISQRELHGAVTQLLDLDLAPHAYTTNAGACKALAFSAVATPVGSGSPPEMNSSTSWASIGSRASAASSATSSAAANLSHPLPMAMDGWPEGPGPLPKDLDAYLSARNKRGSPLDYMLAGLKGSLASWALLTNAMGSQLCLTAEASTVWRERALEAEARLAAFLDSMAAAGDVQDPVHTEEPLIRLTLMVHQVPQDALLGVKITVLALPDEIQRELEMVSAEDMETEEDNDAAQEVVRLPDVNETLPSSPTRNMTDGGSDACDNMVQAPGTVEGESDDTWVCVSGHASDQVDEERAAEAANALLQLQHGVEAAEELPTMLSVADFDSSDNLVLQLEHKAPRGHTEGSAPAAHDIGTTRAVCDSASASLGPVEVGDSETDTGAQDHETEVMGKQSEPADTALWPPRTTQEPHGRLHGTPASAGLASVVSLSTQDQTRPMWLSVVPDTI